MRAAIAAYGLAKQFPTGHGVRSVTFEIPPGEVVALLGPSSSGKSTLLKILATRLAATHGSFAVLGHQVPAYHPRTASIAAVRQEVGALLEEAPVAGDLSGWENAWLLGRLHGIGRRELEHRLGVLFEWAGMAACSRRPARTYSYPMRRKLGLIGALLHNPRVLLLDEPFHGLEMEGRAALQAALLEAGQRGATVLVATSDPAEVKHLATRAILLDGGQVLAEGPLPSLLESLGRWSSIEVRLAGASGAPDLTMVPGLCAPPEYVNGGIRVRVSDADRALAPLMEALVRAGGRVAAVEVRHPGVGRIR